MRPRLSARFYALVLVSTDHWTRREWEEEIGD